jgi:hypothetical protein
VVVVAGLKAEGIEQLSEFLVVVALQRRPQIRER